MRGLRRTTVLAALGIAGLTVPAVAQAPQTTGPLFFAAMTPCRLLDTRTTSSPIQNGETRTVQLWDRCGVPGDARAVYLNVTAVAPAVSGDLQVWGDASEAPTTSVAGLTAGKTAAAGAIVNLDGGSFFVRPQAAQSGATDLLVDVLGYFREATGFTYNAVVPCRLLDTREAAQGPALADGQVRHVAAAGSCQIPADARALAAVITVTQATDGGDLRVYPTGVTAPGTSAINFSAGVTLSNGTIVGLGTGSFDVLPEVLGSGTVHMIVDVSGYYR